jgi:hypothetical protein
MGSTNHYSSHFSFCLAKFKAAYSSNGFALNRGIETATANEKKRNKQKIHGDAITFSRVLAALSTPVPATGVLDTSVVEKLCRILSPVF